jgi:hypothetical protein
MKTKTELYTNEQQIILNKIFEILNIDENNNTFYLSDLDADEEKKNKILELESDIKKYFACAAWACFNNTNIKRKVLSIIRNLVKIMDYNVISNRKFRKKDDIKYRDTIYYFIKNNSI